jgi:tetrahydromethanopterin S-methyltransferase subunit C
MASQLIDDLPVPAAELVEAVPVGKELAGAGLGIGGTAFEVVGFGKGTVALVFEAAEAAFELGDEGVGAFVVEVVGAEA